MTDVPTTPRKAMSWTKRLDKRAIDMSGQTIGSLTVLTPVERPGKGLHFECLCECGNRRIVQGGDLRRRFITSCGCKINGKPRGIGKHPLYSIHKGLLSRCEDTNSKDYPRYGGRGIKVCPAWHDLETFSRDMGPRPSSRHSIDRIDNDGNYEPGNCRWATDYEQTRNRRNNYVKGASSVELCAGTKLNPGTFRNRIANGWTLEEALDDRDFRRKHD